MIIYPQIYGRKRVWAQPPSNARDVNTKKRRFLPGEREMNLFEIMRRLILHSQGFGTFRNRRYENPRLAGIGAPSNCDSLRKFREVMIREMLFVFILAAAMKSNLVHCTCRW